VSADADPIDKRVNVPMPVPRDPAEYRATIHFGQRLRERVPAEHRDTVVETLFQRGDIYGASAPATTADEADVSQYFAFEASVEDVEYRLIAGIRPAAFREPERKHLAVTIMPTGGDETDA
jgi:hypothetical protein